MKHLIFILKTTGISLLVCSLLGFLVGFISEIGIESHPHQMFPLWVVTLVLSAGAAVLSGIIIGSVLSALNKTNLLHSTLYTVGFVVMVLVFFLLPMFGF
jgi:F0F1-type ATP synthase membrane subunit c/vacuolar-type H+-ATPase subunit K